MLRAPPVRQQANGHAVDSIGRRIRPRPKLDVMITLPEAVHRFAAAAAKRRRGEFGGEEMSVEVLCTQIVGGVITRGSIDAALAAWHDYVIGGRCGGVYRIAADPDESDEGSTGIELVD